jgi:hypothetical protein
MHASSAAERLLGRPLAGESFYRLAVGTDAKQLEYILTRYFTRGRPTGIRSLVAAK